MWPEKLLLEIFRYTKFTKLPISEGMEPIKRLSNRSRAIESVGILNISLGTEPVSLLDPMPSLLKFDNFRMRQVCFPLIGFLLKLTELVMKDFLQRQGSSLVKYFHLSTKFAAF